MPCVRLALLLAVNVPPSSIANLTSSNWFFAFQREESATDTNVYTHRMHILTFYSILLGLGARCSELQRCWIGRPEYGLRANGTPASPEWKNKNKITITPSPQVVAKNFISVAARPNRRPTKSCQPPHIQAHSSSSAVAVHAIRRVWLELFWHLG